MSPENAHKLIRIYMGGLILGVNTLYMLSCFLKQFALVGKGLTLVESVGGAYMRDLTFYLVNMPPLLGPHLDVDVGTYITD